jgi:preprotein translocase subunit SecB
MSPPLQLDRYFLTSFRLDAAPWPDAMAQLEGNAVTWQVKTMTAAANHVANPARWKLELKVDVSAHGEGLSPYKANVSFTGFFTVAGDYPQEKAQQLVQTTGGSILYGAIREMLANVTARGPWPMLTLPTVSFFPAKQLSQPSAREIADHSRSTEVVRE